MKIARVMRTVLHPLVILPVCAGVFFYSQHHPLFPGLTGCSFIRNQQDSTACMGRKFASMIREQGLDSAMRDIDKSAREHRVVRERCHLALHPVGERAGEKAHRRGRPLPDVGSTSICRIGYFHGAITGYYDEEVEDTSAIPSVVESICAGSNRVDREECIHAFGHIAGRSSPEAGRAVRLCDRLEPLGDAVRLSRRVIRHQCQYGLFMEYAFRGVRADADMKQDVCDEVPSRASRECYTYLPTRQRLLGRSEKDIARMCESLPARPSRYCVAGVVDLRGKMTKCSMFTKSATKALCRKERRSANQSVEVSGGDRA